MSNFFQKFHGFSGPEYFDATFYGQSNINFSKNVIYKYIFIYMYVYIYIYIFIYICINIYIYIVR